MRYFANRAVGFSSFAGVAAMEDEPVVGVVLEWRGDIVFDSAFDGVDVLARRDAGPISDAENMGVDGHGVFAKGSVEDDIRGVDGVCRSDHERCRHR